MVLNEAAAAGLPLVATEAAGGGYDLIEQGVNGYRVPVEDEGALAEALRKVAADPEWRISAGERSRSLTAGYTGEAWAAAVRDLVRRHGPPEAAPVVRPAPARIALLTEIPAPYRIPLFNALAERDGVDLRVLFLAERDPRRQYPVYEEEFRFARSVLPGARRRARGRWVVFSRGRAGASSTGSTRTSSCSAAGTSPRSGPGCAGRAGAGARSFSGSRARSTTSAAARWCWSA